MLNDIKIDTVGELKKYLATVPDKLRIGAADEDGTICELQSVGVTCDAHTGNQFLLIHANGGYPLFPKSNEIIPDTELIKQLIIDLRAMSDLDLILAKINDTALWGTSVLVDYCPLGNRVFLGIKKPSGIYHAYTTYFHPEDTNIIVSFVYQNSWPRSK